jgi:hypothetical protein
MYRELEDILRPGRSKSPNELRDMLETINVYYYFEKENYIYTQKKIINVNLDEINKLIEKIKPKEEMLKIRKEKNISSIKKAENIIYDMVLNFLMIIKTNMEKKEVIIIEELKLENWEGYGFKEKEKLLNIIGNNFQNLKDTYKEKKNHISFDDVKNKSDLLKNIIEKEENQSLILKLDDLIRTIEYKLVEFEILKKVWKINPKLNSNKRKDLTHNLLSFIKEKSKEGRFQYMFDPRDKGWWMNEVEKIGIQRYSSGNWIIKPQEEK